MKSRDSPFTLKGDKKLRLLKKEGIVMVKDKVLEVIRHLHLTRDNKKDVVACYNIVSKFQEDDFENSIKCYEGRVNFSFKI